LDALGSDEDGEIVTGFFVGVIEDLPQRMRRNCGGKSEKDESNYR
jgi:hypothetical protein